VSEGARARKQGDPVSVLEAPRLARGVGSTEPTLTTMGGTHPGRWNNRPVRIEPDRGKVCENGIKCPQMLSWLVSQTDRAGFHVASG
jgi:hypothetical protein